MARKKKWIEMPFGEDKGMVFQIESMPALEAFDWGVAAICAIGRNGVRLPDDLPGGMAGLVAVFADKHNVRDFVESVVQAICSVTKAEYLELRGQLFECIKRSTTGAREEDDLQRNWLEQVTDPMTFGWLMKEVVALHTNFSLLESPSKLGADQAKK